MVVIGVGASEETTASEGSLVTFMKNFYNILIATEETLKNKTCLLEQHDVSRPCALGFRPNASVHVYVCLLSPYCMNLKIQFKTNIADITNRVGGGFGI